MHGRMRPDNLSGLQIDLEIDLVIASWQLFYDEILPPSACPSRHPLVTSRYVRWYSMPSFSGFQ